MKKVDILLSIYRPNIEYLIEQLQSIDEQSYPNIELIVYDDCPNHPTDFEMIKTHVTNFPVRCLERENTNVGYTRAFERLVQQSTGDYIAFCDQDDVWRKDKIENSVLTLQKDQSLIVVSDKKIIDGQGNVIKESVKKSSHKNYQVWETGDDIALANLVICHAEGMSMVVDGDFARSCLPFSPNTGHDKWLLGCASIEGKISYINETLVSYRRYGQNVSGVLKDVPTKEAYYENRLYKQERLMNDYEKKYKDFKQLAQMKDFIEAREHKRIIKMIHYYSVAPDVMKFELVLAFVPNFLFSSMIKLIHRITS